MKKMTRSIGRIVEHHISPSHSLKLAGSIVPFTGRRRRNQALDALITSSVAARLSHQLTTCGSRRYDSSV